MLHALIFDFDGTIADTETLHMRAFQQVLAEEGAMMTDEDYYTYYLAMNDRDCIMAVCHDKGIALDPAKLGELTRRKAIYYNCFLQEHPPFFPGVLSFVQEAAAVYPLAIASGALRREILSILDGVGLIDAFVGIITAEDVVHGKPDPEAFLKAIALINRQTNQSIQSGACLVLEDSIHGVAAAKLAGMRCVAVTNSYPADRFSEADQVIASFEGYHLADAERLFSRLGKSG